MSTKSWLRLSKQLRPLFYLVLLFFGVEFGFRFWHRICEQKRVPILSKEVNRYLQNLRNDKSTDIATASLSLVYSDAFCTYTRSTWLIRQGKRHFKLGAEYRSGTNQVVITVVK
jgi:hypothetical protein